MKKLILLLVLSILFSSAYSQKAPIKFGKVSIEDLQMKTCEFDTSAPAVVLCDYGYFNSKEFQFIRTIRVKILKKEGLSWANRAFPGSEKTNVKGKTFNLENGEITEDKLKNESVFKERIIEDYYRLQVAMPNVKVGSIMDIEFRGSGFPMRWRFQQEIPVKWSELRIEKSEYVHFRKNYSGYIPFYFASETRWITKNVPAFKEEAFTNSANNYITKFEFDLQSITFPGFYRAFTTTWEAVCERLDESEYFGQAIRGNLYLNSVAKEIKEKATKDLEKLKLAYEEVKRIKWNEQERLFSTYPNLSAAYNKEIGSSSDINLTLISLLNKLDLNAHPIIMSTRKNGLLPLYPTLEKLNYVICYVKIDNVEYFLDATEELLPINLLPERCLNGNCRVVSEERSMPIMINAQGKDKEQVFYDLTLNEDNSLTGTTQYKRSEYAAFNFRKEFEQYSGEDEYLEHLENEFQGLRIKSMDIENLDSIYLPVKDKYEIQIKNQVTNVGEMIYLQPMLFHQLVENPFKLEERKYPVDYAYQRDKTYLFTFVLPENYEIIEIPENIKINFPEGGASISFNAKQFGNRLSISYRFKINKVMFLPSEYHVLKEFYNQIIKKHAEPVIIKKI